VGAVDEEPVEGGLLVGGEGAGSPYEQPEAPTYCRIEAEIVLPGEATIATHYGLAASVAAPDFVGGPVHRAEHMELVGDDRRLGQDVLDGSPEWQKQIDRRNAASSIETIRGGDRENGSYWSARASKASEVTHLGPPSFVGFVTN
jgi:hypothetical protein